MVIFMKLRHFLFIGLITIMLTGCASVFSSNNLGSGESVENLTVGHSLEIENIDSRFKLIDNNSVLAADGLYYVSWGIGEINTYGEGDDAAELYDATLYLILGESKSNESAKDNMNSWYEAALSHYEILEEDAVTINGQEYTIITYNYNSLNKTPYMHHGASAFGTSGNNSVCIELTCCENFNEDLKTILTGFLGNCSYVVP